MPEKELGDAMRALQNIQMALDEDCFGDDSLDKVKALVGTIVGKAQYPETLARLLTDVGREPLTVDHPVFKFVSEQPSIDGRKLGGWVEQATRLADSRIGSPFERARLLSVFAASLGELTQRLPDPAQRLLLAGAIEEMNVEIDRCLNAIKPDRSAKLSEADLRCVATILTEQNFAARCAHRSFLHGPVRGGDVIEKFDKALRRVMRGDLLVPMKPPLSAGRQIAELFVQAARTEISDDILEDRLLHIELIFDKLVHGAKSLSPAQMSDAFVGFHALFTEKHRATYKKIAKNYVAELEDLPKELADKTAERIEAMFDRAGSLFEDEKVRLPNMTLQRGSPQSSMTASSLGAESGARADDRPLRTVQENAAASPRLGIEVGRPASTRAKIGETALPGSPGSTSRTSGGDTLDSPTLPPVRDDAATLRKTGFERAMDTSSTGRDPGRDSFDSAIERALPQNSDDDRVVEWFPGKPSIDEAKLGWWPRQLMDAPPSLSGVTILSRMAADYGNVLQSSPAPSRRIAFSKRIEELHDAIDRQLLALQPAGAAGFPPRDRPSIDEVLKRQNFAIRCAHRSLHHDAVDAGELQGKFKDAVGRIMRKKLRGLATPADDAGRQIGELFVQAAKMRPKTRTTLRDPVTETIFLELEAAASALPARQMADALVGAYVVFQLAQGDKDAYNLVAKRCASSIGKLPEGLVAPTRGRIDDMQARMGTMPFEDHEVPSPDADPRPIAPV
ncbi:MAG: hypothetical protein ABW032_08780 [Burkholderiaceae bacterium]